MDTQLDKIMRTVVELQSTIKSLSEANGTKDGVPYADAIKKDELEKMKADLILEMDKRLAESKKPNDPGDPAKATLEPLNKFLLKVKCNDQSLIKTAMSEGTGAQGGYTVPVGYDSKIFGAIHDSTTIVPKCTPYPHAMADGFTKKIPRWLTGITITNTAEATVKPVTKPTLSQPESVLKKMTAIVVMTDELLADNISSLDQKCAEMVGRAMAVEQERQILVGNTGAGDPFMGLGYAVGVNAITQIGVNFSYPNLLRIVNYGLLEEYHTGAELYMNRASLNLIMGLVDANNRPLWNINTINNRMQHVALGVPINLSSTIPVNLGGGANTSMIFYGNYEKIILGFKEGGVGAGIAVDVATQAIISTTTNVTINLWTQDETGFRFVKRHSVVVIVPAAFVRMTGVK